jgi:hypothetical protein
MSDFNRDIAVEQAPPDTAASSRPAPASTPAPRTVYCKRCSVDVEPSEEFRCPRCHSFLPGNPGAQKPEPDQFSALEDELLAEAGPGISVTERVRISAFVAAHRVLQQAIDAARKAADPREALALLKLLDELPPRPVTVRVQSGRRLSDASAEELRAELSQIAEILDVELASRARKANAPPGFFDAAATPELAEAEASQAQQVPAPSPDAAPENPADPSARPARRSPASESPTAQENRPRTIGDTPPEELDDDLRILLYGENDDDIARRKQREAEQRRRATDEMLNNIGRPHPWLDLL